MHVTRKSEWWEEGKGKNMGGGGGGYCTHIFVVHHLHESEFSERPLCICLVLKRLHKLLDCHPLPSHCVHGRAGGRGD